MAQSQQERPVLRIGSRGSPLALAQAREVKQRLVAASGLDGERIEIKVIRTTGDAIQDRPLAEAGGKALFTKEIEEALLSGAIDLAGILQRIPNVVCSIEAPHAARVKELDTAASISAGRAACAT